MSPRPQIDHIRRPQLLAAAAEVISERGFDATRIADVAERAGTSPSAILYWFESRDELLAEALIADENRFDEDLSARLARLDSPSARLLELLEASANEYDWTLWIELWTRASTTAGARPCRGSSRRGPRAASSRPRTSTWRRTRWPR